MRRSLVLLLSLKALSSLRTGAAVSAPRKPAPESEGKSGLPGKARLLDTFRQPIAHMIQTGMGRTGSRRQGVRMFACARPLRADRGYSSGTGYSKLPDLLLIATSGSSFCSTGLTLRSLKRAVPSNAANKGNSNMSTL